MTTIDRALDYMERAARQLNPLVLSDDPETARAAHDILNTLAAARIQIELHNQGSTP